MSGLTRCKVLAYSAALFLAGGICGATATLMIRPAAITNVLAVDRAPEIATNIQKKLQTKLDLTPEQLARIQPWTVTTSEALEADHLNCLQRIDRDIIDLHQKVAPILNAEQKIRLVALDAERRETFWQKYHYREQTSGPAHQ